MSAPDRDPVALRAAGLVKTYPARRGAPPIRALDGLTLDVAAGSVHALLGRNGAGKSTTVKILTTLARPEGGNAAVLGLDVARDAEQVRRVVGLVPQKSSADPMATGRENVQLAARIHGLRGDDARRRAGELLARFGLAEAADRLARTYSGGMARKLDVAIGLVHRPGVLFLDEPTTGLDPEARAAMWQEIRSLARDRGTTVVLTTHYLDEADHLADRVTIVDRGRVVVDGTPDELKREMCGDTIQIELAAASPREVAALAGIPGVRDLAVDGHRLRARADSGAHALPQVLAALERAGAAVVSVGFARPSLDDVYLHHVGSAFDAGTGSDVRDGAAEVAA